MPLSIARLLIVSCSFVPFVMAKAVIAQELSAVPVESALPEPAVPESALPEGNAWKSCICHPQRSARRSESSSQELVVLASPEPEQFWPVLRPSLNSWRLQRGGNATAPRVAGTKLRGLMIHQEERGLNRSGKLPAHEPGFKQVDTNDGPGLEQPPRHDGGNDSGNDGSNNRFAQRIAMGKASMLQVRGEKTLPFETDLKLDDEYKTRYELNFRQMLMRSPQQEFSVSFGFAYRDEERSAPPPRGLPPLGNATPGQSPLPAGLQPSSSSSSLATAAAPPLGASPSAPRPSSPPRSSSAPRPNSAPGPAIAIPSAPQVLAAPPAPRGDAASSLLPPSGAASGAVGEERTTVLQFSQDYSRRDRSGSWRVASRLNFGTGLLDATATTDDAADGQFFSWKGELRRSQTFSPNHQLSLKLSTQLSPDALMGSEQFKIGNGPKIEGLRIRDDRGDNGVRLTLENRFTLARHPSQSPLLEIMPLMDMGYVWNQTGSNTTSRATEAFSVFGGLGLNWSPNQNHNLGLTMRVPLHYANDLNETAADKDSTLSFNYRMRW